MLCNVWSVISTVSKLSYRICFSAFTLQARGGGAGILGGALVGLLECVCVGGSGTRGGGNHGDNVRRICGIFHLVLGLRQDTDQQLLCSTLQGSLWAFGGGGGGCVGHAHLSGHEEMTHGCVCCGWQRTPLSLDKVQ